MRTYYWKFVIGSLIGLALVVSACDSTGGQAAVASEAKVSQSFSVDPDVKVTITTYNGAIEIRAGGEDQVKVDVTRRGGGKTDAEAKADLDNIQLSLTQAGGAVKLIASHKGQVPNDSAASFVVSVPSGAALNVTLDNGTVVVDGVKGAVTATAGNGDVTIRGVEKAVLAARTTNGNVTLAGREIASLTASSSNGDVSFDGSLAESKAANRIDVGNGSATLKLPGDAQFSIDALTANGSLTSDFEFQGNTSPKSIKGTIGTSPAFAIVIRVKNGSIAIKK